MSTQLVPDPVVWATMSLRERQVFIGVCEGLSDKQIAFRHDIAPTTVKVHLRGLRKRVGACSRVGIVVKICALSPPRVTATSLEVVLLETPGIGLEGSRVGA